MASPRNSSVSYESRIVSSEQNEWCVTARSNNIGSLNDTWSSTSKVVRLSVVSASPICHYYIIEMGPGAIDGVPCFRYQNSASNSAFMVYFLHGQDGTASNCILLRDK